MFRGTHDFLLVNNIQVNKAKIIPTSAFKTLVFIPWPMSSSLSNGRKLTRGYLKANEVNMINATLELVLSHHLFSMIFIHLRAPSSHHPCASSYERLIRGKSESHLETWPLRLVTCGGYLDHLIWTSEFHICQHISHHLPHHPFTIHAQAVRNGWSYARVRVS